MFTVFLFFQCCWNQIFCIFVFLLDHYSKWISASHPVTESDRRSCLFTSSNSNTKCWELNWNGDSAPPPARLAPKHKLHKPQKTPWLSFFFFKHYTDGKYSRLGRRNGLFFSTEKSFQYLGSPRRPKTAPLASKAAFILFHFNAVVRK